MGLFSVKYRDCRNVVSLSAELGQGLIGFLQEFRSNHMRIQESRGKLQEL